MNHDGGVKMLSIFTNWINDFPRSSQLAAAATIQFMLSDFHPLGTLAIGVTSTCNQSPWMYIPCPSLWMQSKKSLFPMSCQSAVVTPKEVEENKSKGEVKFKWIDIGPDITEEQKEAISQLPPRMTKRCKALMKRIICHSPQDENLHTFLAAWVRVMKPRRADWLSILKEMKILANPLLFEVMEYALLEDSFEANARDYTKLIHGYAKHNLFKKAENAFQAMKSRGFVCDQVTLTVLVHMYSKAGDLNRAKAAFEEIKLLGLPLDKRAYGSMVMAYIRAGILELAESLIQEMNDQEIYAGKEVYKAMLRAYSTIGNSGGAQRVFDAIQLAGIVPDSKLCALLVSAYCVAGQSVEARSVLENMRRVGLRPSDKCIALMLGAYEKENLLDEALELLIDLETDGPFVGQEASEVLVGWFGRIGVVSEVEQVLRDFADRKQI